MPVGQVVYTPWCDDDGKVIDDGTVARLAVDRLPLDGGRSEPALADPARRRAARSRSRTSANGSRRWRCRGRRRRALLAAVERPAGRDAQVLPRRRPARLPACRWRSRAPATPATSATSCGCRGTAPSRSGTRSVTAGRAHALRPAGMLALDVARVEAGLLLTDVDFHSSRKASIDAQMYTPAELGLGRLVALDKASPFVGREALRRERAAGHRRQIVGLEVRWRRRRGDLRAHSDCRRPRRPPRRGWRCRSTAIASRSARPRPPPGRRR